MNLGGPHLCVYCTYKSFHFHRLINHYKLVHAFQPNFRITCNIENCHKSYRVVDSFSAHLRRKHSLFYKAQCIARENVVLCNRPGPGQNVIEDNAFDQGHIQNQLNQDLIPNGNNVPNEPDEGEHAATDKMYNSDEHAALFLLRLRENHHTTQATCTYVANEVENLLQISKAQIISDVKSELAKRNLLLDDDMNRIIDRPLPEAQSFERFSNTRYLDKYITNTFGVVHPVEEVLGVDEKTGKQETMQYIPLLQTLAQLLKHEDVLAEIFNGHQSNDGYLRDYCDGTHYKSNPLFQLDHKNLQIQFYNDDFTVVNPLGSRAKNYKISAFYYSLGNIRPKYRSKLHVMQLVALCNAAHLKKYGHSTILHTCINDISKLEEDGLEIEFEGRNLKFFGTISYIAADNLAAHSLGRFPENFSSSLRLCRHCNASKVLLPKTVKENKFIPRTKEIYEKQVTAVGNHPELASLYGVKEQSPLNKLKYFHVAEGLPSDIAHDIFGGVVKNVLETVIVELVNQGLITYEDIRDKLVKFSYCEIDKSNKPTLPPIGSFKLKQTESQMWCLVRLLPFAIGNQIPEENQEWGIISKLLDVIEYVCAPSLDQEAIIYMKSLIEDFWKCYLDIFPDQKLTPKGHYMLHYASEITVET